MSAALVERSATWMARAVRAREVSAVELFDAHAARIAERDPQINALVLPRLEEAREEAVAADAAPPRGALHGVPFTAKDPLPSRHARAERLEAAPRPRQRRRLRGRRAHARRGRDPARQDQRLRVLELVGLGEPLFGATANPHDLSRTAGGSSGGEAARSRAGCRRSGSAPTSAARSATRATSPACSG
jgi:hypothetical protein